MITALLEPGDWTDTAHVVPSGEVWVFVFFGMMLGEG
jgi:hypothetical protein